MTWSRASILLVLLAGLVIGRSEVRASCGAEGCPLDFRGPEAVRGVLALNVNYQFVDQNQLWNGTQPGTGTADSHGIIEQETRTRSMVVAARAELTRSLAMSAMLPYILDRLHRHEFEHHPGYYIPSVWEYSGLGDLVVMAHWTPAVRLPARASLTLQGGSKLPTGKTEVPEVNGEQPEPSARPGTGSYDWLAGLQVSVPVVTRAFSGESVLSPITLSAMGRANGVGTENYKMGNEVMVNLAGSYPLWGWVGAIAQVNFDAHRKDDPGLTDADPHHTGSISVLASPGLQLRISPLLTIFGYGQFRAYEHTNGPQLVAPLRIVVGSTCGFGI